MLVYIFQYVHGAGLFDRAFAAVSAYMRCSYCVQYRHQEQLNFNRCRVFIVAAAYLLETFFDGYTVKLRGEIQITRAERSVKKRFHKYAFGVNAVRGRKREVYRVSFV